MNPRLFPKPPPAEPLPLEIWLDQADRSEVGREPFFRGRDEEFDVFRRAVNSLDAGRIGGGTMVFQGAPGAGKSALMEECLEAVRRHSTPERPWVAVTMNPDSLRSPVDVIEVLVDAANGESVRLREVASGSVTVTVLDQLIDLGNRLYRELSERGGGAFGLSLGGRKDAGVTAGRVFRNAAPLLEKFHVVVCVDEAQNMPVSDPTRGVLDCLHRDPQGIPLVAAFFGLGDTQDVLSQCGLSRFARGRIVNLAPLSADDAACAIRDMLATYGFMGTSEVRSAWVDNLAKLSQGWPQHINSVSVAASRIIRENGCRLDSANLDAAMAAGEEHMNEYYAGRLSAGSQDPGFYKRLALVAESRPDGVLPRAELRRLASILQEELQGSFDDLLTNALHAGLLAPIRDLPYHYHIPIPSLSDYLRALPVEPAQV